MKKNILRILSFVMVAALALTLTGLVISAEEWEIPTIEEVSEEELGEEIIEEEMVEVYADEVETEAEAEAALYDGDTLKGYYGSFEGAVAVIKGGTFSGMPTVKLLKDVTLGPDESLCKIQIDTGKKFVLDGQNHVVTDEIKDKAAGNAAVGNGGSIQLLGTGTYMVAKNVRFTRSIKKAYAFFHLSGGSLELSDNAVIGGTADSYLPGGNGTAVFLENSNSGFYMTSPTAAVRYCKDGSHGVIGVFESTKVRFEAGVIENCSGSNMAIGIRKSTTVELKEGFVIRNCGVAFGSSNGNGGTPNAAVKLNGQNITGCTTYGVVVQNNTSLKLQGTGTITGCAIGINVASAGRLILDGDIDVVDNTNNNIYLGGVDRIEVTGNYTGTAGVYIPENVLQFGHLAEGVTSYPGKLFYNKDATRVAGTFASFMGSGKIAGTEHSLMNTVTNEDLAANALIIPYKYYSKNASGTIKGTDTYGTAQSNAGAGGTVNFLTDINASSIRTSHYDIAGNSTLTINGNGHTFTMDSAYTEKYFFAIYGKKEITFTNFVFNGNGKGILAYVANNSGGGVIRTRNCLIYNTSPSGNAGGFYTTVSTAAEGYKSEMDIKDTRFVNCKSYDGTVVSKGLGTVKIDNVEFSGSVFDLTSGNQAEVRVEKNSTIQLGAMKSENTTGAGICLTRDNQVTIRSGFNSALKVTGSAFWIGTLEDGLNEMKGTLTSASGYQAVKHGDLVKTATASVTVDGKTYSFKNKTSFSKDEIPDNGLVLNYPMYRRTGSEGSYTRTGVTKLTESQYGNATIYLLQDVVIGEHIGVNTGTPPHINIAGVVTTVNGNGHKISRTDGGDKTYVVYSGSDMTFENIIYDGNEKSALAHTHSAGGKGGIIRAVNSIFINGGGDGALRTYNSKEYAPQTVYLQDSIFASSYRAITGYYNATINVSGCDFVSLSNSGIGGAIKMANDDSLADPNNTLNLSGTNLFSDCHSTGNAAGAIYINRGTLNIEGDLTIEDCSCISSSIGGAIYIQDDTTLNMQGKLKISGNTHGATEESNIYVSGKSIVNIVGDILEGSAIGISITNDGGTFAMVANADIKGLEYIYPDGKPASRTYADDGSGYVERPVVATLFPNTVGTGKLNGATVIDMTDVNNRIEGRELDVVFNWPWMAKQSNGIVKGFVSLSSAAGVAAVRSGVLYAQKDINAEYHFTTLFKQEGADIKDIIAHTELPLYTPSGDYNHIDFNHNMTIDGNGHVITADKSGNYIFVIYGGGDIVFENVIYNGAGKKVFANINNGAPSNGTETLTIINSYIESEGSAVLAAGYGGTMTVEDSTVEGNITIQNGSKLIIDDSVVTNGTGNGITIFGQAAIADKPETEKNEAEPERRSSLTLLNGTDVSEGSGISINGKLLSVTVDKSFDGQVKITSSTDIAEVFVAGEGFESLDSVNTITKGGATVATCAYYDASTGKFGWTAVPAYGGATDSGVYADGEGIIRFMTTFTTAPATAAVENFGTYALFEDNFTNNMNPAGATFKKFVPGVDGAKAPTADGQSFIVDVVGIPEANKNTAINAISFTKLKGIETPVYYYYTTPVCVGDDAKDLGEKNA